MKAALNGHVEQQRHVMFQRSADEVRNLLQKMVRSLQEILDEKADEVFLAMRRDYRSVLGGGDLPQGEILPKAQRLMRKEIMGKINKVDKIFRRVAGLEVEDDQEDSDEEGVPSDDSDKVKDQSLAEPDTIDHKGHVSPFSVQIPFGPHSASTAGTFEPETQRQAVKDEPTADAPIATTTVKAEPDLHATTDRPSNVPEVLAVAKPTVTEELQANMSANSITRSSTTRSPIPHKKDEDHGADSDASADDDQASTTYELLSNPEPEDLTHALEADGDSYEFVSGPELGSDTDEDSNSD